MHHELSMLLTIVLAVGFGLAAQVLAHRWRIPAIVLLLLLGVLLGPAVLGLVQPGLLGEGLTILVKLAVAVILFEGALNLRLSALRDSAIEVRNLVSIGVLVTWLLTTLVAHFVAGLGWPLAILFGALLTVTGPTVVQPLLKRLNVPRRVKTILEGEAILIDPIGAILAVAVLDVILSTSSNSFTGPGEALWAYFGRLIIGLVVGASTALLISRLMKVHNLIPADLSNLVVLAGVWMAFGVAEALESESGIMASVAMGLALQRQSVPGERQLRHFKETLTTLSISILFILLAANLKAETMLAEGLRGVLTILLIMLVVRPASVFISTWRTSLSWREKALIAWIGPRGIVAASVASLFGLTLAQAGFADGQRLTALTFLAITMTVTIQGLTAPHVARSLKLHSLEGRRVVIVGANRLGLAVARILRANGRPVSLVDTNQMFADEAAQLGFDTVHGNALDESVLEEACIGDAETLVAVTSNSEVNVLVSQLAADEFAFKRAYPVLSASDAVWVGAGAKTLAQSGIIMGFGRPLNVFDWEHAEVREFTYEIPRTWTSAPVASLVLPPDVAPVLLLRGQSAEIVHAQQLWQPKDRVVFLTRGSVEEGRAALVQSPAEEEGSPADTRSPGHDGR